MIRRWIRRSDQWSIDHPWRFGLVMSTIALYVGIQPLQSVTLGVALAIAFFALIGWSYSRGPGRRRMERRLGRTSRADEAP